MMKHLTKAVLMIAVLGTAACTNPDRFGNSGGAGAGGAGAGANDASDPNSVAYFQQTVGDRVLFEVDQSTLNDAARVTLSGQAGWLNANPEYSALIEGHADEQGTREYNLALGARRANAVQEYMSSQGITSSRMRVVSFGKERPIEICSEETCYTQNRRAVTVVSAGGLGS